jgi:hypothetical protein
LHLVKRAAVATWRLDRCVRVESGRLSERATEALGRWDAARAKAIEKAVARMPIDPESSLQELESSRDGAIRLIEIWRGLGRAATTPGGWVSIEDHHRMFFLLQGFHAEDMGDAGDALLRFLLVARPELVEGSGLTPLKDDEAREVVDLIVDQGRNEVGRLTELWHTLPDESAARTRYAELAAFAPHPEDASLLRYEAQFDREFRATINQLARLAKSGDDLIEATPIEAPNEPNIPVAEPAPEPAAPIEANPEPAAPNEPNAIVPNVPTPQSDRDRDSRLWAAVTSPEGSDLPQSVGWNR